MLSVTQVTLQACNGELPEGVGGRGCRTEVSDGWSGSFVRERVHVSTRLRDPPRESEFGWAGEGKRPAPGLYHSVASSSNLLVEASS
jgi:hypothetical protein